MFYVNFTFCAYMCWHLIVENNAEEDHDVVVAVVVVFIIIVVVNDANLQRNYFV